MRKREKKITAPEELVEELEKELVDADLVENVEAVAEIADEASSKADDVADDPNEETAEEEVKRLTSEIETLRAELEAKKKESERIFAELAEFATTFPGRSVDSITSEVWESMRGGIPLAAAYALYEKKREASEDYAKEINKRNAERSSGAITSAANGGYYSPAEVRMMTPAEVKRNYKLIIESMKKWN